MKTSALNTRVFAKDHIPEDAAFALARMALKIRRPRTLHVQDYGEVFWVQSGQAVLLTVEARHTLKEGSLALIPPGMPHAFTATEAETYISAVLVPEAFLDTTFKRHAALLGTGFWRGSSEAVVVPRSFEQRVDLSSAFRKLETGPATELKLEAFLLTLLASLPRTRAKDVPEWLANALELAESPAVFRDGAAGLVRVSEKTAAHVSRTCQKALGQSPSQVMNTLRMAHAARLLSNTDSSLIEIAEACGLSNLSHFHRLFQAHHDATPAAWRRAHQRDVIAPE